MKKSHQIKIYGHLDADGSHSINLDNIGLQSETMQKCINIIKQFAKGDEIFFGFYRTDGINMNTDDWVKYDKLIPIHFKSNGRYEIIPHTIEKKGKIIDVGYLTVGILPINSSTFELLPGIFHYYLETTFFCPKVAWNTFVQSYRDYMKHGVSGYINNGYADFLFTYADSGHFSISFNPNLYDENDFYNKIVKIVSE